MEFGSSPRGLSSLQPGSCSSRLQQLPQRPLHRTDGLARVSGMGVGGYLRNGPDQRAHASLSVGNTRKFVGKKTNEMCAALIDTLRMKRSKN